METVAISIFKAKCLAILERVRKTGEPVLVTRRGVPVAEVGPPPPADAFQTSAFGALRDTASERGDILEPLPSDEWEALS